MSNYLDLVPDHAHHPKKTVKVCARCLQELNTLSKQAAERIAALEAENERLSRGLRRIGVIAECARAVTDPHQTVIEMRETAADTLAALDNEQPAGDSHPPQPETPKEGDPT